MESTISILITIAALILSVYFYIKSRKIKRISFSFSNNVIIDAEKIKFEKLKINYENNVLKSFNTTIFTIENDGNQVIDFNDIDENDKLRISLLNNHKIFDYSIIERSNKSIDIDKLNSDTLFLYFKFLNPGDFIKIQILHNGASDCDIKLEGRVKGINSFQAKIKKNNNSESSKNNSGASSNNWFFKTEFAIYSAFLLLFLFVSFSYFNETTNFYSKTFIDGYNINSNIFAENHFPNRDKSFVDASKSEIYKSFKRMIDEHNSLAIQIDNIYFAKIELFMFLYLLPIAYLSIFFLFKSYQYLIFTRKNKNSRQSK